MTITALVGAAPLRRGMMNSSSVELVQRALAAAGHQVSADGDFGVGTEKAVMDFQAAHALDADGIVGGGTARALDQFLDIDGLDRDTVSQQAEPKTAPDIWPRQSGVSAYYGEVGKHQTTLILPYPMRIAWDLSKTVSRFSIHEKVHDSAKACFDRIADAYDADKRVSLGLDLFGGCLNVRKMRGGSSFSMHSWAIAIDFDPERNQLKWGRDRARLAQPDCETFWRVWESAGWVSLGRVRNYDLLHF